jgi:hypothetical protein
MQHPVALCRSDLCFTFANYVQHRLMSTLLHFIATAMVNHQAGYNRSNKNKHFDCHTPNQRKINKPTKPEPEHVHGNITLST